jgi:uncharacterized UPF0160 family protein
MLLTGSEFVSHVANLVTSWWPARSIVHKAISERTQHHASGSIIILDKVCPWKDHLFELEHYLAADSTLSPILYALYNDIDGSWRIQAVPLEPTSFHSRKKL